MGNGVSLKCPNECLTRIDNVNKTHISPNIQVNNFLPLNSISNSYINIDNSFYKLILDFFNRNIIPINNFEISIIPKLNNYIYNNSNTYIVNELKSNNQSLKKEIQFENNKIEREKEIDLNYYNSKINSINSGYSNYTNEKEKFKLELKKKQSGYIRINSIYLKHIKEEYDISKKLSDQKLKKLKLNKEEIEAIEKNNEKILRPYIHFTSKNLRKRKNSSTSILSNISNAYIIHHPKGYFQYKHLNYIYLGKSDNKNNKNGFGIITYEDKSKIIGNFINDKLNGYAKFIDLHSIYTGNYIESIPKGFGIYIKDNISTVGDDWEKNHLNGIGIQIYGYYTYYQGDFNKSVKEGVGLYHWNDDTICFGEWSDDKMNGYGVIKYANGNIYVGEFKNNSIEGWGEFLWNDGKYFWGEYKNGLKHGFGIYVIDFKKCISYIGFWEYGQTSGFGIKINDNEMIVGIWKDGRRLNHLRYWEIKDYLKPNQAKYTKFLHHDIKFYKQFISKLYDFQMQIHKCKINCLNDLKLYI